MDKIVAATGNPNKVGELENITSKFGLHVISRDEAGVPHDYDVVEDGETFEDNSLIKAEAIMKMTGLPAIADDSGLMVDALDGAPGVYSARFAGEDCDDDRNNDKLLDLLKDVPAEKRTARFVSVITLVYPDGRVLQTRGECEGRVLTERHGTGGFGYDPLFLPDGLSGTFAEVSQEEKDTVSHRARALAKLGDLLKDQASGSAE
ncbi:MAG: XTP/dITP diphosphatase [Eubacteriales bacterium]|nr:XTP/dITP diphosphatase [Eubacteriales bacterium]